MEEQLTIALNGLAPGRTSFGWHVGGEFFGGFDNSEILDADLEVGAVAEKSGKYLGIDLTIKGTVTVACDRCLDDLLINVDKSVLLSIKFGDSESAQTSEAGDREIVYIPESDTELDLSQTVYDYACLSLPMIRVHEDGKCNPVMTGYLNCQTGDEDAGPAAAQATSSPFASLKDLLKDK